MGLIYTRKKEDKDHDERTMNSTEFVERILARQPEKNKTENKIESIK